MIPKLVKIFGKGIIMQFGGGIHANPMGTKAGAMACRQALDATLNDISLKESAKKYRELKVAIDKWGLYKEVHPTHSHTARRLSFYSSSFLFITRLRMKNNKILSKFEKYSPWIRINRRLTGPIFIIGAVYILIYLVTAFYLWSVEFQMTNLQQTLYFIGFGVFIIAVYLAFTRILLRSVK